MRVNAVAPGEIETAMLSPATAVLLPRISAAPGSATARCRGHDLLFVQHRRRYVTGTEIFVTGDQHLY